MKNNIESKLAYLMYQLSETEIRRCIILEKEYYFNI